MGITCTVHCANISNNDNRIADACSVPVAVDRISLLPVRRDDSEALLDRVPHDMIS